jgi:N-glycosylase/DNA lyase
VTATVRNAVLAVQDYDLAATLASGQAFRWRMEGETWVGVVAGRWVRLKRTPEGIEAMTATAEISARWLEEYLQTDVDLNAVLSTFPDDEPMRRAITACRGLRLLRQDPWECLASFILSSTKQIVQIQQIVGLISEKYGNEAAVPPGCRRAFAFPAPERLAQLREDDLRACKMGFRAPYLLAAARQVANGSLDLEKLRHLPVDQARTALMELPGVGQKIADCVLLFAYGFQSAFPIDVWVENALRTLYFPKRPASRKRLRHFSETHFGPNAGYAQQYLFHYMRTVLGRRTRS